MNNNVPPIKLFRSITDTKRRSGTIMNSAATWRCGEQACEAGTEAECRQAGGRGGGRCDGLPTRWPNISQRVYIFSSLEIGILRLLSVSLSAELLLFHS